jgi:O-antigen ligase
MFNNFLPKTQFGSGIPDIDVFRAVSYFLFLFSMLHWSIKKDIKIPTKWILILGIFYVVVIASVSWSNFDYNLYIIRKILDTAIIPFFIAFVALNLFQKEKNAKVYIQHLVIAAFILSVISIIQMVLALSEGSIGIRTTATFANPNMLAIILVLSIPCLLHAKEQHFIPKIFGWIATFSIISGIICSVSRKGIVTMIVCFSLYYFFLRRFKSFFYTLFVLLMVVTAFLSFEIISGRFETTGLSQSFENKWDLTLAGLKMFKQNPLYGMGFEGYRDNYSVYFPWKSRVRYDAHNIFITALANYGIIGFIPFLSIFLIPLIASYKTVRKKSELSNERSKDMALICLTTVIPFMINGWFAGGLFYSTIEMSLFYSNIALFLAVKSKNR